MSIRNSKLASIFYRFSEKRLLPVVNRYFQNPNHLSTFGAVLAAGAFPGFWIHPIIGFLMIAVSAIVDVLDGQFARAAGRADAFGAFWDSTLDRISDFFYLAGFWVLFRHDNHFMMASFMIFYGLISTLMISYVKARAEALGKSCRAGWMERGIRTIYLIIWALLLGILPAAANLFLLWGGLGVYCTLTTVTVVQRIMEVRSQFPYSSSFQRRHNDG